MSICGILSERPSRSVRGAKTFDHLLVAVDELDDDSLDRELRALELEHRELQAHIAVTLAAIDARRAYRRDGHRSLVSFQRATCNSSFVETRRRSKLAELFGAAPVVGEAVFGGIITVDHALEIDRIRANPRIKHVLGDVVDSMIEHAEQLSFRDFRQLIDQFICLADQDGSHRELNHQIEHRNARVDDIDDAVNIAATGGDPITATRLTLIFEQFCQREFEKDAAERDRLYGSDAVNHGFARNASQRRFDALVSIFDIAAAADTPGSPEAPIVNVVIDEHTLHEAFADHGMLAPLGDDDTALELLVKEFNANPETMRTRRCHTETGAVIHPHQALQAALQGHIRRCVINSRGVTIDLGVKQRLFTGHARTAAQLLHAHCTHPGCQVSTRQAEIDHRNEYHLGGPTDQENATIRCSPHNRYKHRHKLKIRTDDHGRTYTIRPDGTIMLPVGAHPPLEVMDLRQIVLRRLGLAESVA